MSKYCPKPKCCCEESAELNPRHWEVTISEVTPEDGPCILDDCPENKKHLLPS